MTRRTLAMLAVLFVSVELCVASLFFIREVTEEMDQRRVRVLERAEVGDGKAAREELARMAEAWSEREEWLETLAPHETLHQVTTLIIQADAALGAEDEFDFYQAMALLGEVLRHLYEEERLSFANLL